MPETLHDWWVGITGTAGLCYYEKEDGKEAGSLDGEDWEIVETLTLAMRPKP